jgi:hypothetical protein
MGDLEKAATLMDEQHAQLVGRALEERGIPYVLRSYHDSVYDGIYQSQTTWGHVEAPAAQRELVKTVVRDLAGAPPTATADGGDEEKEEDSV